MTPVSGKFGDALAWIDRQGPAMADDVIAWSKVNSGSHNLDGLAHMGALVSEKFAALGAERRVIVLPPGDSVGLDGAVHPVPRGPVYAFTKRPEADRKVLLTGHIDTVFPADHPFQEPRALDDNTLNGPGVADMKGGILVMLTALEALERSGAAGALGWEVLISSDEETGSLGSGPILAERARIADFGMTYEPALADGTLAGARKGSGNFTIVLRGKAAHAGREFDKGRNAVTALAELIGDLNALNGRREGVTVNPAIVHGGTAPNIVPDLALCRFNIRMATGAEESWVMGEVAQIVARHDARDGFSAELHGGINRPPKPLMAENEHLFRLLRGLGAEIGIEVAWTPTGGCCEGNNLAAAGLPNIDTLGVRGGKIHSDEEFVLLDSFAERAKLSALLLLSYASGELDWPPKGA
ncbi:MAG: hydrolase [Sphingomonadales bacterium]|nr:hydrolase [Sphingomonadales bacterium]